MELGQSLAAPPEPPMGRSDSSFTPSRYGFTSLVIVPVLVPRPPHILTGHPTHRPYSGLPTPVGTSELQLDQLSIIDRDLHMYVATTKHTTRRRNDVPPT